MAGETQNISLSAELEKLALNLSKILSYIQKTKCCFIATNGGFYMLIQKYKTFHFKSQKEAPE